VKSFDAFAVAVLVCACGGTKTTTTAPVPSASAAASSSATVTPVAIANVDGGIPRIDPEAIRAVVRANARHFTLCYAAALKKTKGLTGRVETKFVIDETGHVISAEDVTHSNVLQDDDARNCIVSKFRMLEFPPPQPSGKVPITYPLLFDPSLVVVETADAGAEAGSTDDYAHSRKPFDQTKATAALAAVDVKLCAPAGYHGSGHIKVTFDPSGVVTKTEIDSPATIAKPASACITKSFAAARIPVFDCSAVTVGKNFAVP
jgi:hypothetical protein